MYLRAECGGIDLEVICGGGADDLSLVEELPGLHLVRRGTDISQPIAMDEWTVHIANPRIGAWARAK